ncbi:hypothetical protein M0802_011494 [Mischocyttarus mexicanus]|nr:hypothetical protein M0802_011494 [Mischocyttarus mexicanus]
MKIKVAYLLMCIKFLLVLSTTANKREIIVKFKRPPFKIDLLTDAVLKVQSYEDSCKKLLLERKDNLVKFNEQFIKENSYNNKIEMIKNVIENLVKDVEYSTELLDNIDIYFLRSNGSAPRRNAVIKNLYLVSNQIVAFEKLIRQLSNIDLGDTMIKVKWNQTVKLSLQYIDLMKDVVDRKMIDTLSKTKNRLLEMKSIVKLKKGNLDPSVKGEL